MTLAGGAGAAPGGGAPGGLGPRVTVVIATRDRADELATTIGHLRALPERPPVIVVDNDSSDGSVDRVRRQWPDVTVVALPRNAGAAARTAGVRRSATPYVAFSDDDSWWAPGALARAADTLDAYPRLGVLAAKVLLGRDGRVDPTCEEMAASPLAATRALPGPPVLGFIACAAVVRRDAYLSAGGFCERLMVGGEEELLAIDLAAAGFDLAYVDAVTAHHHPSPARDRAARGRRIARNRLLISWLRRPTGHAVRATLAAAGDAGRRPVLVGALPALPWALRHRRVVPPDLERALRALEAAPVSR